MRKGEMSRERKANMEMIASRVIATLVIKNPKYGESWKSHGGFSAFFNTQRKWSRAETLAGVHNFDVFEAMIASDGDPDSMIETIMDLIGYLLLIVDDQYVYLPETAQLMHKENPELQEILADRTADKEVGDDVVTVPALNLQKMPKCDGNHGGPACPDPECWIREPGQRRTICIGPSPDHPMTPCEDKYCWRGPLANM